MSWRQDHSRPVRWTKDGRLVYNDYQETDPVLAGLRERLRALIRGEDFAGLNHELYQVCKAMNLRSTENERRAEKENR